MRIADFQQRMRDFYFDTDSERGVEATFLWLVEEVGELSEAVRGKEGAVAEEELADVIAWTMSLANLLGVDLEAALEAKYADP